MLFFKWRYWSIQKPQQHTQDQEEKTQKGQILCVLKCNNIQNPGWNTFFAFSLMILNFTFCIFFLYTIRIFTLILIWFLCFSFVLKKYETKQNNNIYCFWINFIRVFYNSIKGVFQWLNPFVRPLFFCANIFVLGIFFTKIFSSNFFLLVFFLR